MKNLCPLCTSVLEDGFDVHTREFIYFCPGCGIWRTADELHDLEAEAQSTREAPDNTEAGSYENPF